MTDRVQYPWEFQGETLTLETPEQTTLEYRVAPFGTRMLAALFDRMIIWAVVLALFIVAIAADALRAGDDGSMAVIITVLVVGQFLITLFYYAVGEVVGEGQTWGKRRCGIRTIMATGHGITLSAALLRNLARVADDIPVFWLVPALVPGKRRFGDMIAGTFVVVEERQADGRKKDTPHKGWLDRLAPSYRELDERRFPFTAQIASQLHQDDLNLLEYLEDRVVQMPSGRRRQLLLKISMEYVERLGLEEDKANIEADPRRFLQELGLFLRDRFENRPI